MLKLFEAPVFGRGFRPFFFLGTIYSILTIGIWGASYIGLATLPSFFLDPVSWHVHEMIYGFSIAIVAGFLLTAVANWTGGAPARQAHLAVLCALWLAGRIVMSIDLGLPLLYLMFVELAFVPTLTISLAIPLLRSWNQRNFTFLTLLSILFACDFWFLKSLDLTPLYVALMMILVMVSLIGGRIIPAFTVAALRRKGIEAYQTAQPTMDKAALLSLAVVSLCFVFARETVILALCAGLSALIHGARMRYYHTLKTFDDPLLWILHVGYGWLIVGLVILGLTGFKVFEIPVVIHALTVGCIGSITLGMICRVTLGHTGRDLKIGKVTMLSFVVIQITALIRILGPLVIPAKTIEWIVGSAILWSLCFLAYLWIYTSMLFTPRADGHKT